MAATILAWAALATLAVLSPGPDTLLVAGQAARRGVRAGLLAVAGTTSGGVWYMALCGFGFLSILTASPTAFAIVKLAGAVYLAWLGIDLVRGATRPIHAALDRQPEIAARPFRQGLMTNALNPKVAVFYLSALPQLVGNGPGSPIRGVLLIAIHYLLGAVWLSTVAIAAGRVGGIARRSVAWRWIEASLGTLFIGLAGKIVWERN